MQSWLNPRNVIFALAIGLGLIADQATKIWVRANLSVDGGEIHVIPGFFSIVHRENPGAALSLLADFEYRHVVFGVFTLIALVVIFDLFRRLEAGARLVPALLGLIVSGALGNAIDRLSQRTVTDFLEVYTDHPAASVWLVETFGTNHYPTFNIADAALVLGVVGYIVTGFVWPETDAEADAEAEADPTDSTPAPLDSAATGS